MLWFGKKKKEEPMATQDEKEIDKAKKDVEEKGADTQTEKDRVDESVGGQEAEKGETDSQTAKDRVDESEGEQGTATVDEEPPEAQDESVNFEEVIAAQAAKISAMESEFEAMKSKIDELMSKDEGRDFGGQVTVPEGSPAEDKRNAVFEGYAGSKAKNYY